MRVVVRRGSWPWSDGAVFLGQCTGRNAGRGTGYGVGRRAGGRAGHGAGGPVDGHRLSDGLASRTSDLKIIIVGAVVGGALELQFDALAYFFQGLEECRDASCVAG